MENLLDKLSPPFNSKRFWMAVAGVLAVALYERLGLSEEQTLQIAALIIAWIWGDTTRPKLNHVT